MKIFNLEIKKALPEAKEIALAHLKKIEINAIMGLAQAKLDLKLHELLLESTELKRTKAEIKGYTDAIERDKKAINNFNTQLRAINYEQN